MTPQKAPKHEPEPIGQRPEPVQNWIAVEYYKMILANPKKYSGLKEYAKQKLKQLGIKY